jgi:hypothetical protein
MVRSIVHLAHTLAKRMEIDHAPSAAVEALKFFAEDRTVRQAEKRTWSAAEEKRCERQRTLFAMLPSCNAVDRLKAAMLQRAYNLLWDGDPLGSDALLEFLPSKDVEHMHDAWAKDFDGDEPKSEFYEARA